MDTRWLEDFGSRVILGHCREPLPPEPIYETQMAEGLKAMALEGRGLPSCRRAW
jgi:hypothetical protein